MIDNLAVFLSCLGALFVAWRAMRLDVKTDWFETRRRAGKLDRGI